MLAYFQNFRVTSDIVVFRDHADPQQFYILNDRPRIAVDSKTGLPLFHAARSGILSWRRVAFAMSASLVT